MTAVNNLSVFVPHVFPNFDQKYVTEAFSAIGEVNRVDFVAKLDRDGKPFNSVYVHFNKWWDDCEHAKYIQSEIEKKGSAQFYHDDSKYYWIVLPNTSKKHNPAVPKHKIDIGDDKAINSKVVQKEVGPSDSVFPRDAMLFYKFIESTEALPPRDQKMKNIAKAIMDYEDNLSDGFGYYGKVSETMEKIAKKIIKIFDTPEKVTNEEVAVPSTPFDLEEWDAQASEDAVQMAEMEDELVAEDANLVSIDKRYLTLVEEENLSMRCELTILRQAIANLDMMYQAEVAKVRAFSNM